MTRMITTVMIGYPTELVFKRHKAQRSMAIGIRKVQDCDQVAVNCNTI